MRIMLELNKIALPSGSVPTKLHYHGTFVTLFPSLQLFLLDEEIML